MTRWLGFLILTLVLMPIEAKADGKFFGTDRIPPNLPYQRAIIAHKDGKELLIVQSKFDGPGEEFGWVIPVPGQPLLGSFRSPEQADHLFITLQDATQPETIHIIFYVYIIPLIALLLLLPVWILGRIKYSKLKQKNLIQEIPPGYRIYPGLAAIFFIFAIVVLSIPTSMSRASGIRVISSQKIGIYDTQVVRASDPGPLIDWLGRRGFQYSKKDEESFKTHIDRGWCFVVARIDARELTEKTEFKSRHGLVHPLILLFDSKDIIYPLALTGTIGKETEVLLYVLSEHRTETDGRFEVQYAGPVHQGIQQYVKQLLIEPSDLIPDRMWEGYLARFHGRLAPHMMQADAIFRTAPDDQPYQKRRWRW